MSEADTLGIAQRLQGIRKGLNALRISCETKPQTLWRVQITCQLFDRLEAIEPGEIQSRTLSALEELIQGLNASHVNIPGDELLFKEGKTYFEYFERWGNLQDLQQAIVCWESTVNLTMHGHDEMPRRLSNLGVVLLLRFERLGSLADLDAAMSRSRRAVDLAPDDHPNQPRYLHNLGNALYRRFKQHGSLLDLEDAIEQKRRAVDLASDDHPDKPTCLSNLGSVLQTRFEILGSPTDLDDAILQAQKAVDITPEDHPDKAMYLNNLGNGLERRFDRHGSLIDLDNAVLYRQKAVDLTPDDHPGKLIYLSNIASALETRFNRFSSLTDLENAILQIRKAVDLTPDGHFDKPMYFSNLGNALYLRFDRRGSLIDLEDAVSQHRKAVDLTPDGQPSKPMYLNNLGNTIYSLFERHDSLTELGDAISQYQRAIYLMPHGQPSRATTLNTLCTALIKRLELLADPNDLQRALSAARESAECPASSSRVRLQGAASWARCCILASVPSLTAWEYAIKLLPRIAWLGIAVDDQYFRLASNTWLTTRDAVAAAIMEDENATAVEWAEEGRSIVWQNLLSLRTPLEELHGQYPELASQLLVVSRQLEQHAGTQSTSRGAKTSDATSDLVALATKRDRLIDEVRSKPDFGSFLRPKSLDKLASAAREGPVVFLNLGMFRCDALILLADDHGDAHVVTVPLERVTLQSVEQLSKKLVDLLSHARVRARDSRKVEVHGDSESKDGIFKEILRTLWLDYVKPVVDGLAYQANSETLPRLWWCTTGPLAFLPLHAAGLYDVEEAGHKLSDYVVSSYTPTLAALLDESSPVSSDEIKILAVAISNTPGAPLPCTKEETKKLQQLAANYPIASLINEEATRERVLEELETSTWAHLACHGEQVGGKPMESRLVLHDGKLKLSDIVKARLPNAEFAFLSACQTAVGDGGVPEESAHLAAGMLFAGYRGVVATMWSIQDNIAPRVAEEFYRYVFRNGQPSRAEAAYALHRAVRSLQESKVPFTSWVPFIHMGR